LVLRPAGAISSKRFLRHSIALFNPANLVRAYMWHLVATKRANEAGQFITKEMTAQQIEEAEQQASAWVSRLKKLPPLG
jgi:hypothetical protein